MQASATQVVGAAGLLVYGALWCQVLPQLLNKIAFNITIANTVICASAVCRCITLLSQLRLVSRGFSENLARCATSLVFKAGSLFAPHVRVVVVPGSIPWASIPPRSALALNHTSFMDTVLYLWRVPFSFIWRSKTLYKSTLEKLWFFGQICRSCGQFPVFFKNTEEFSVEKDRQAAVSEQVNQFLSNGGGLSFFPEGAVNKTPQTILEFRYGSFTTILQHKLPVYYLVTWGCQDVWPAAGVGGRAATILVKAGQLPLDFSDPSLTAKDIATRLRVRMQDEINDLQKIAARK